MKDVSADGGPASPLERLERLARGLHNRQATRVSGVITEVSVSHYRVAGLSRFLRLGECVSVNIGECVQIGEVVKIDDASATLKPFDARCEAAFGARAYRTDALSLSPDSSWKGRVIDALGRPLDGMGELAYGDKPARLDSDPPPPLRRARMSTPIRTGVRVIDLFTPLCLGQRVGVFAGSGVGKSSLLAMLARAPQIDTVVIALVGERGRDPRIFRRHAAGGSRVHGRGGRNRRRECDDASPGAENGDGDCRVFSRPGRIGVADLRFGHSFRSRGRDVALAAGEPAVARGYAPSVFSDLRRLLERAGPGEEGSGSITGIFSVLVVGVDHIVPVADAVRGALDGHIVLDRAIADEGRYPAVNVLSSVSRLAHPAWTPEQRKLVANLRALIARYEETRELRLMGGYTPGADALLDKAIKSVPRIYEAMTQSLDAPRFEDPFIELAASLRNDGKSMES